ncbi:MAG: CBS domain-containing protein, partial [Fimbriimonadaceae bacterium]
MKLATFRNALKAGSIEVLRQEIYAVETEEAAELLREMTPAEGIVFLRLLGKDVALEAFEKLSPADQAAIVEGLDGREVGPLLDQLDPSDLVDLLDELPAKVVSQVVSAVGPQTRQDLNLLLGFPEDSVGRSMSPRYLAVREDETVGQCLERVRTAPLEEEELDAVFVVDATRKFVGVATLPGLLRAASDTRVGELANGASPIVAYEPLERATRIFRNEPVSVLPVVDREERLIGCIRATDAIELVEEEDAARLTQFGGTSALGGPDIDLR